MSTWRPGVSGSLPTFRVGRVPTENGYWFRPLAPGELTAEEQQTEDMRVSNKARREWPFEKAEAAAKKRIR